MCVCVFRTKNQQTNKQTEEEEEEIAEKNYIYQNLSGLPTYVQLRKKRKEKKKPTGVDSDSIYGTRNFETPIVNNKLPLCNVQRLQFWY